MSCRQNKTPRLCETGCFVLNRDASKSGGTDDLMRAEGPADLVVSVQHASRFSWSSAALTSWAAAPRRRCRRWRSGTWTGTRGRTRAPGARGQRGGRSGAPGWRPSACASSPCGTGRRRRTRGPTSPGSAGRAPGAEWRRTRRRPPPPPPTPAPDPAGREVKVTGETETWCFTWSVAETKQFTELHLMKWNF